jgi:hypothetical protein
MDVFDLIAGACAGAPGNTGTKLTVLFVVACALVIGVLVLL